MNKVGIYIALVVVALIGIAGAFLLMNNSDNKDPESVANTQLQNSSQQESNEGTDAEPNQNETPTSQNASVEISNYAFSPSNITVKKGGTVTWTNQDNVGHDVTPDSPSDAFRGSSLLSRGKSYSFTFNTVGTYGYFCSPHNYMKGTVTVVE